MIVGPVGDRLKDREAAAGRGPAVGVDVDRYVRVRAVDDLRARGDAGTDAAVARAREDDRGALGAQVARQGRRRR